MNPHLLTALLAGGPVTAELIAIAEDRHSRASLALHGWFALSEQKLAERIADIARREFADGVRVLPALQPMRRTLVQVGGP